MLVKASVCRQLMSCPLHLKCSRTHELVLKHDQDPTLLLLLSVH